MTCECYRVAGWSSSVARRAHNPKVVGSNPAPATRKIKGFRFSSEAFFRKRDLFPSSYPQYPCFSRGTTQLSSCGSITMRSPAEDIPSCSAVPYFLPVARSGTPHPRKEMPARATGRLATTNSVDEIPCRPQKKQPDDRPPWRAASFAAVYSWSNRSSTRCMVMPSSEAAANASATLSLDTTIKTYSSPPVSHSRIVRP